MDGVLDTLTRGNVPEVKVVLASVVLSLAVYQLVLIAVGYGKLRPRFLAAAPAASAHRAAGDAIVVLVLVVAGMCVLEYGLDGDEALHVAGGLALVAALAVKIVVVRWWHAAGRALPVIGTTVFVLLAVTWITSAGGFLAER